MPGFDTTADYYEVFANSEKRLEREGPFLKRLLKRAPGPRVADLACGTGLHALFMAALDAQVTALDLSAEMVQYAREHRPHTNITYDTGDMRTLGGGPWDLVLCLGNSLSLLPHPKDLVTVFDAVSPCLARDGLFAVQILNYLAERNQEPRHRVERRVKADRRVVAVKNLVPDDTHTLLTLTFFDHHNAEYTRISDAAVLRNVTADELEIAARAAGLETDGIYGGFDESDYDAATSADVVAVLRKP